MPEIHSQYGHSAVSTFEQCPFKYKCQYIDHLTPLPTDDAANALVIGTALHRAIETDIDTAINEYFNSYPIIDDLHINEEIKLRYLVPKVKEHLPEGIHEVQVVDTNFIGTLDLLVPVGDDEFDLYDFKYISQKNQDKYMESRQLHIYKYYFEKCNPGKKIRNMYFVFVPKVQIRQKKTETLLQFRQRLMDELEQVQVTPSPIEYDPQKVIDHLELTQAIMTCEDFPKHPTKLCDWCDYKDYCEKGELINMALPSTERVAMNFGQHKKIWIYGPPFSGKTTVCDDAPTPLNLNTDGNVKGVTMPRLSITNTKEGRQTKLAWKVFEDAIADLEAGSDFETIVVDLLEDTHTACRLWMYDERDIEHESDDLKTWDMVKTKFLSTIKRLMDLPYNVILISHEDTTKDIFKKSNDKITAIKPNIQEKIATKIAGMVDIVFRVVIKDDGSRWLSAEHDNVIFGGGRLKTQGGEKLPDKIPLSWAAIEDFYALVDSKNNAKPQESVVVAEVTEAVIETETPPAAVAEEPAQPVRRTRRTRV